MLITDNDAPSKPVITHPIVGVMENRWVTVEGSRSLSFMEIYYVNADEKLEVRAGLQESSSAL